MEESVNLGSGDDYRDGWTNIDYNERYRPSDERTGEFIVHDLEKTPWPLDDNQFKHALVDNVLEHIDPRRRPDFLSECRRVIEPGGVLVVKLPTHQGWDVTHYSVPPWYWSRHPRHKGQWDLEQVEVKKNLISEILPKKITLGLLKYNVVWAAREVELHLR